jgi:hypothetical protein
LAATFAVEPISSGAAHFQDHRHRPAMGERTVLPDSTARPQSGARPRNEQRQHDRRQDTAAAPAPERNGSSTFDTALIAGALPPEAKTMDDLIRQIGSNEFPPESEARLKDILA